MYKDHLIIAKPSDSNQMIWRYMNFTKFISVLDSCSLFFNRSDKFEDPFEGMYSDIEYYMEYLLQIGLDEEHIRDVFRAFECDRKEMLINCWHMNEYESAGMWNLYSRYDDGIAIQSSYEKLCYSFESCEEDIHIGQVKYIDRATTIVPLNNGFQPFFIKRKSFEHERELRAVYWNISKNEEEPIQRFVPEYGINIPVNLDVLIENIYISPYAAPWIAELVKSLLEKYGLQKEVIHSSLYRLS